QFIEVARDGTGAAAAAVVRFFEAIEFFDDGQGNNDFAAFKGEERFGIVDKNVCVENEGLQFQLYPTYLWDLRRRPGDPLGRDRLLPLSICNQNNRPRSTTTGATSKRIYFERERMNSTGLVRTTGFFSCSSSRCTMRRPEISTLLKS